VGFSNLTEFGCVFNI